MYDIYFTHLHILQGYLVLAMEARQTGPKLVCFLLPHFSFYDLDTCFSHPLLFYHSSMTHSQRIPVYCDQKRELVHFGKLTPPLAGRIPEMQMPAFKSSPAKKKKVIGVNGEHRLRISALLMLVYRTNSSVLSTWRPYYEGADAFEEFAASVRCIRSQVCEDNISLKDLHAGARWLKGGDTKVMKMPMQLAASPHMISTKSCDEAARKTKKQQRTTPGKWKVKLHTQPTEGQKQMLTTSSEDIHNYTILNASDAPAGDFFCRLKRSNDGEHFNEVAQCKCKSESTKASNNQSAPLSDEMKQSVSRGDAFIMISQHPVAEKNIPKNIDCAVVGPDNFHAYFGPLSGTVVVNTPHEESRSVNRTRVQATKKRTKNKKAQK